MAIDVKPGPVVFYTDIVCAWSTLSLRRFYAEREKAGLTEVVRVDHRLFLLEDLNRFPVPKKYLDAEIPVVGALAPDMGWKPWRGDPSTWPITSLLPNEAVHAAKAQSWAAAEELDMALRLAFFRNSRPISACSTRSSSSQTAVPRSMWKRWGRRWTTGGRGRR